MAWSVWDHTDRPESLNLLARAKSKAGFRLFEEFDFIFCRFAPKDLVSMWITPETIDDGLVAKFEIEILLRRVFSKQSFRYRMDQW